MIEIFFYTVATIFLLFFLGYGLTWFLIPDKLKSYIFWLSPWFAIIFIIFSLTLLGLSGFAVKFTSPFVVMFLILLDCLVFLRKKRKIIVISRDDLFLIVVMTMSIVFNLYPLIKTQGFATIVSMGNNDIHAYAKTADYLINHSIAESLHGKVDVAVGTLLQFGYRWGGSIITSFFLNLFQLAGFQYLYIFQVVLFGLTLPLMYLLTKTLYKNDTNVSSAAFLSVFLLGFNANLLYMLYHNFLGQIIFTAFAIVLIIFFASYFHSEAVFDKKFNRYDYSIGLVVVVLYFSYHEGIILILLPIGIYYLLRSILTKNYARACWWAIAKISTLVFISASYLVIHAANFMLFYRVNEFTEPIGWQPFRSRLPYANPFEMMGFYSIHSFPPLPPVAAWILSLITILIIIIGFFRSKNKLFIAGFVSVYIVLFVFVLIRPQFWLFNRIVTYSIPLFSFLFAVGVAGFFTKNNPKVNLSLILFIDVIIILGLFSSLKLNARFIKDRLAVDKGLISLQSLKNQEIHEPIYTERLLDASLPWWKDLWAEYFLSPQKDIRTAFGDKLQSKQTIVENGLFLLSKSPTYYIPPRVLFKDVMWQNNYYVLGKLCMSDHCLLQRLEDLSAIHFGQSNYEDSLLISGWSVNEASSRWSNAKKAVLRLVIKNNQTARLKLEVLTLKQPQEMSVYLNDQFAGKFFLSTTWKDYSFDLKKQKSGVYKVTLIFSHLYQPSRLGISQDDRTLSASFKSIRIE